MFELLTIRKARLGKMIRHQIIFVHAWNRAPHDAAFLGDALQILIVLIVLGLHEGVLAQRGDPSIQTLILREPLPLSVVEGTLERFERSTRGPRRSYVLLTARTR